MEFKEMELIKDNVKVTWNYIGEGISGEYNRNDEKDVQLLRFDIYHKNDGDWGYVENSSHCTNFLLNTSNELKQKGLETIMNLVFNNIQNGDSIKRLCESISHIDESCNIPCF